MSSSPPPSPPSATAFLDKLPPAESCQQVHISVDCLGLVERPDEVLAARDVDGCLAAHARVDHGGGGGWDLDDRYTAHVRRRDKTHQIAHLYRVSTTSAQRSAVDLQMT